MSAEILVPSDAAQGMLTLVQHALDTRESNSGNAVGRKGLLSHRAYQQYLVHKSLADPQRQTDVIARGRQLAATAGAVGVR